MLYDYNHEVAMWTHCCEDEGKYLEEYARAGACLSVEPFLDYCGNDCIAIDPLVKEEMSRMTTLTLQQILWSVEKEVGNFDYCRYQYFHYQNDYVYELHTDNGLYQAGLGNLCFFLKFYSLICVLLNFYSLICVLLNFIFQHTNISTLHHHEHNLDQAQ